MSPKDPCIEDTLRFLDRNRGGLGPERRREDLLDTLWQKTSLAKTAGGILKIVLDSLNERGYKGPRVWARNRDSYQLVAAANFPEALIRQELSFQVNNRLLEELLTREHEFAYLPDALNCDPLITGPFDPVNYVLERHPNARTMLATSYSGFSENPALANFKGLLVLNYDPSDLGDIEIDHDDGSISFREEQFLSRVVKFIISDKVVNVMEQNRARKTGLYDQYKFHKDLSRFVDDFYCTNTSYGLMLIDIDDFKAFNTKHGHFVGDQLIVEVGKILRTMENKNVRAYHQGGDEFAIISRGDPEYSMGLAQKFLDSIRGIPLPLDANPLTSSIGLAMTQNGLRNGVEWGERADKALYKAKDQGRNRFSF
jgi:diguanylate cyclase (GGDEF)-like protein